MHIILQLFELNAFNINDIGIGLMRSIQPFLLFSHIICLLLLIIELKCGRSILDALQ